jgi:hypothetical protein
LHETGLLNAITELWKNCSVVHAVLDAPIELFFDNTKLRKHSVSKAIGFFLKLRAGTPRSNGTFRIPATAFAAKLLPPH